MNYSRPQVYADEGRVITILTVEEEEGKRQGGRALVSGPSDKVMLELGSEGWAGCLQGGTGARRVTERTACLGHKKVGRKKSLR